MIRYGVGVSVVEAAMRRIQKILNENKYVILSFSGGKDSITLADLTVKTMQKYRIPFSKLIVTFFDEEAMYPDVIQIVSEWRMKFMSLGARFVWYCLPIKHFNCCNRLSNDETFICWDPSKIGVWVRPMPKFAVRNHPKFKMGMNYQTFAPIISKGIPTLTGVRLAESLQRETCFCTERDKTSGMVKPLYDWVDNDIWLYIQRNDLKIPDTYLYLYKVGVPKNKLRISQFFSIDTIKSLPKVVEFYPNLYERILRREPNAELAFLYWDTDMFRSGKQNNKFKGAGEDGKDYKRLLKEEMVKAHANPENYPGYKSAFKLYSKLFESDRDKLWADVYRLLIAGDPKGREYRSINKHILCDRRGGV